MFLATAVAVTSEAPGPPQPMEKTPTLVVVPCCPQLIPLTTPFAAPTGPAHRVSVTNTVPLPRITARAARGIRATNRLACIEFAPSAEDGSNLPPRVIPG